MVGREDQEADLGTNYFCHYLVLQRCILCIFIKTKKATLFWESLNDFRYKNHRLQPILSYTFKVYVKPNQKIINVSVFKQLK